MTKQISIYSDGGSRGNPGPAAFAFVVIKNREMIHKVSRYLGKTTNNVAEYKGAREAMRWIQKNKEEVKGYEIDLYFDSQLVVKQLTGEYKIKDKKLIPLASEIKKMEKDIDNKIFYHFVRREKNKLPDELLNEKLDAVLSK
ncbi:ribonuclease HI family protein [Candidatus Woesebacteria bacterium]|nr:ribonuclease HI family protein [Candidatus Woesebacteria bacterium]